MLCDYQYKQTCCGFFNLRKMAFALVNTASVNVLLLSFSMFLFILSLSWVWRIICYWLSPCNVWLEYNFVQQGHTVVIFESQQRYRFNTRMVNSIWLISQMRHQRRNHLFCSWVQCWVSVLLNVNLEECVLVFFSFILALFCGCFVAETRCDLPFLCIFVLLLNFDSNGFSSVSLYGGVLANSSL